ncbi:MAG: AsmA-like C-terminal region-containing protein [Crocinitomicaceae bacterium]
MSKKTISRLFKWSKWIFASLVLVCLLITLGVYLLRDRVVGIVVGEINKSLNAPVKVGDADLTFWGSFPNISVDFNEVFVHDAIPEAKETDTLFYSKKIRLKFNPIDIIHKNYKVKKIEVFPGYAHIKHFADGRSNFDITKPSNDSVPSNFEFTLHELAFENFRLDYSNFSANQYHSTVLNEMVLSGDFTDKVIDLNAESDLKINYAQSGEVKLVQNKTAYFNLNLRIDQENGIVRLAEAPIEIDHLPFTFALEVHESLIDVRLKGKDLQLVEVAKSFQHQSTEQIAELKGAGKVAFDFHYFNQRKENETGKIECNFGIDNGTILEPSQKLQLSNINVKGFYGNTDEKKGEHLALEQVSFRTVAGPFSGNLVISEFSQPHYQGKANGRIDLAVLHAIFPLPNVERTSGKIEVDTKFDVKSNAAGYQIRDCDGNLDFVNVQCQLQNDKRYFDHITGRFFLKDNTAGLEKISLTVGNSDLALDGRFDQIQSYLNNSGNLIAQVKIRSAFIDVQDFSSSSKAEEIANGRNYVLPNDIEANIDLLANNLTYEAHQFKKLSTELQIRDRNLHFKNLALQNSQADIQGSVLIQEKSPEIFTISTDAHSENISFQPVFAEWNNFEQSVITSNNISGKVAVDMQFTAPFDLRSGIKMKDIVATVKLRIDEGRLKNVEAFKSITASLSESSMTRILLKQNNIQNFEKNLLDLKFESLENIFTIKGGKLNIPKMTIASNAMTVNLSGTHDFDNQVDYHFDFNLRDIKKTQTVTEFGTVVEDGTGLRLFAHMFGPMDDPTIKWDQQAKRELAKANIEAEKQSTKEMLKADFGLFKKDTTVRAFQAKEKPKEEIQITFGGTKEMEVAEEVKVKKDTKITKALQKWKDESQKDKDGNIKVISQ